MTGTGHLFGPRWPRKPFALTTGDPRFDPTKPVTVNGFRFEPTGNIDSNREPGRATAPEKS